MLPHPGASGQRLHLPLVPLGLWANGLSLLGAVEEQELAASSAVLVAQLQRHSRTLGNLAAHHKGVSARRSALRGQKLGMPGPLSYQGQGRVACLCLTPCCHRKTRPLRPIGQAMAR